MKLLLILPLSLSLIASSLHGQEAAAPAAPQLDFGDHSSATITGKAWDAIGQKQYDTAIAYADKCIEMYNAQAVEMQKALTAPLTGTDEIHAQWALNDVGTSYFIKGQALEAQGKKKEAVEAYKFLAENLAFAQTWDPQGWFWKPADAAREMLAKLEFDTLE